MKNEPCGCGSYDCDACARAMSEDPELEIIMNEKDCCDFIREVATGTPAEDLVPGCDVETFAEAGVLTSNKGLILRFPNGREFQVTVVRCR